MKIDGHFRTNMRFADNIYVCTEAPQALQRNTMVEEIVDESRRMGLKMNIAKAKVTHVDNSYTPINVNNVLIENVEGYIFLGKPIASRKRTRTERYTTKNHGSLGGIRQTPGYLKK